MSQGIRPRSSLTSTRAPAAINASATSACPNRAAMWMAACPYLFVQSRSSRALAIVTRADSPTVRPSHPTPGVVWAPARRVVVAVTSPPSTPPHTPPLLVVQPLRVACACSRAVLRLLASASAAVTATVNDTDDTGDTDDTSWPGAKEEAERGEEAASTCSPPAAGRSSTPRLRLAVSPSLSSLPSVAAASLASPALAPGLLPSRRQQHVDAAQTPSDCGGMEGGVGFAEQAFPVHVLLWLLLRRWRRRRRRR